MQPIPSDREALPYQTENSVEAATYKELEPPPTYTEIHPPPYRLSQQTSFQSTTNYGACPTAPPPPYTPSPSRLPPTSSHRPYKGEYIPESGIMMPLNASASSVLTEESSSSKKYAAYFCCALFLIIVMFAAYLGRNSRKYHSHYRYNFDWSN